jgi:hypothetical protein
MLRKIINKNELILNILYIYIISVFTIMCFITLIIKIDYFIKKYELFNTTHLKEFINLKKEVVYIFKKRYDLDSKIDNYECYNIDEINDIEKNLNSYDIFETTINEEYHNKLGKQNYTLSKCIELINNKIGVFGDSKTKQE